MKWINKGHEFDEIGKQYAQIKNLYIWGAGVNGEACYNFLKWLGADNDFNIVFVDSDSEKQAGDFCGVKVISPQVLFERLKEKTVNNTSVMVVTVAAANDEIMEICAEHGIVHLFNWIMYSHSQKNNFIQHFLCIWLLYKRGKLLSHWMNFVVSTRCNLNCKGCAIFYEYHVSPQHVIFDEFKHHIDLVFSKYDMMYSFHLSGGEPLLNKEFGKFVAYVNDTYGDRIYDLFVVTNGTIVPSDQVLSALQKKKWWMQIDDYTAVSQVASRNMPKLLQKLREWDIPYQLVKAEHWFDLFPADKEHGFTESELIEWRGNCNTYLQAVQHGKIYSCCYVEYARTAGVVTESENEFIDIATATKAELLEFRMGYTTKGYIDYCKRCHGVGKNAKHIPAAVQNLKVQLEDYK